MNALFFIPGLGADERLFSKLKLYGYEKRFIKWISPVENESLPEYAKRLSVQIDNSKPFFLIGVSFGGMIAVEISKILKPEKLILISSAKNKNEIPRNLTFFKYLPVYKMFSDGFIRSMASLNRQRFGIFNEEDRKLFADMLLSCPKGYFREAIRMVLRWENNDAPDSILHIHGDKDHLFPIQKIKNPTAVRGGTHFMPYHKAEEVERILLNAFTKR